MKIKISWLWFLCLSTLAFGVFAQTNVPPTPAPLPTSTAGYWDLAIAGVTPLLVTGIRKIIPSIPTVLLPTMTPLLGILLGLALNALAGANLSWFDMAKAGALAVFVREVTNQAITKRLAASDATTSA